MPAGSQSRTRRPSSLARVRGALGRKGLLRPSLAAAIVGTILSLVTWWGFSVRETRLAELDFSTRADSYRSVLQAGIDDYVDRIQAIQVLFGTMGTIPREQFLDFSNALLLGHPAILAVSWVPRVTQEQRAEHEHANAQPGYDYRIWSQLPDGSLAPAADGSEYFPVLYSFVAGPTTSWIGTNMDDGRGRGRTLARARETGRPATSERVRLLSGTGDGNGFFIMMPVYRPGQPQDSITARRNVLGIVQGVFQTGVMIE